MMIHKIVHAVCSKKKNLQMKLVLPGLFLSGAYQSAYTLSVEIVSKRHAALTSIVINFPFVAGELYLVLAAYLFRDYRDMIRFAFGTSFLLLAVGFFIPESPRWLIAKKRYQLVKCRMSKKK